MSIENQRIGGQLFTYDLEYQLPPSLPADLNLTIVRGQAFTYQIKSNPPAFVYTLSGGTLPTGVSLNAATGILEGNTTDAVSSISLSLAAMNGKGTATVNLNLSIRDGLTAPVISSGEVLEVFGRGARIRGLLSDAGGAANEVSIHYGLADAGTNANDWNHSLVLGGQNQGAFEANLNGLDSGKIYFYRFETSNGQTAWSDAGSFTTLLFDQGILRIHTGDDEYGTNAGIFWDRNDGEGETKVVDANMSIYTYLAPNGSSWRMAKAKFQLTENLLFGENLEDIRLTGINALSFEVDGNLTVAKNLIGSPSPALPHLPAGTLTDGYDAYYADDPGKGLRMGRGSLGGFAGGMGPGKGESLGSTGAGGITGGGGSFAGEGGSGASGPAGIRYGSGGLDLLMGGSGGGLGNGGEAGAGGGAIEFIVNGKATIHPGVKISMNGGTVFVNPTIGANFSGGAGSGGAVRL
jgi:hypothetical protein